MSHLIPPDRVAIFAALAVFATGCWETPRVEDTAPPCPDDQFGCVAVAPSEPITIGTVLEVSGGPDAIRGRDAQKGAHLAAQLVFEAIEIAAIRVPGGGLLIPRTRLRDALFAATNASGVTGDLRCDDNGDCQPETRVGIYAVDQRDFANQPSFATTIRLSDL